jgi:hypothetical protein
MGPYHLALLAVIHAVYSRPQNEPDVALLLWLVRAIYQVRKREEIPRKLHLTRASKQPINTPGGLLDSIPVDSIRVQVSETLAKLSEPGADELMTFMSDVRALVSEKDDEQLADPAPIVRILCQD